MVTIIRAAFHTLCDIGGLLFLAFIAFNLTLAAMSHFERND